MSSGPRLRTRGCDQMTVMAHIPMLPIPRISPATCLVWMVEPGRITASFAGHTWSWMKPNFKKDW